MIKGNVNAIAEAIDLSQFGISFSAKPIIHGGAAMEYYGWALWQDNMSFLGVYTGLTIIFLPPTPMSIASLRLFPLRSCFY